MLFWLIVIGMWLVAAIFVSVKVKDLPFERRVAITLVIAVAEVGGWIGFFAYHKPPIWFAILFASTAIVFGTIVGWIIALANHKLDENKETE